jgi:PAS domain S-box-containing protein
MERAGALSFLAIPLVVGGRLFGHLAFDDCKQERIWGEIEIDLLRAAASALAVSLEREQATAALTHSELRFRDLVQSVDAIVYEADAETFAFEFVSEKVNDILGFPRERWIEEPMFWQEHIHEEDRERVLKLCRTATAEMRDHQFEYRMIAADGREVWLRDLVTVEVADGRPSRLRGLMIDITAERRVAEAMQQGQKFMEDLVANSPMGLSMYLPGGMTISTNDAQRRLLAIEDFAWDADNFNILTDPIAVESGLADVARRAFDGETVELAEVVLRLRHPGRSTGPYEERLVEVTLFPGIDARGNVEAVVGFTRDVTERRRQDDVLREAQKLESLGVLAGGVAHDLNNLLLGILGNASLAMDDTSPGSPAYFSLQEIELAGQRAAELGRQMLDYSGRSRFRLERLDASTLIDEMRPLLKAVVPVPVGLTFDLADGLPHIEGDAGQLRQVMLNMVLNAGEAFEPEAGTGDSPPAEIFVVTRAREVAEDDLLHTAAGGRLARGQYAVIEVRDTGSGIDPVMLDRIFDPFFTTRFTGRGLGLAAALGIVRGHGGGIAVDSIPGRGTIFSIFLPVAEDMRHD